MSMRTPPELRYERFLEQYVKDKQHIIRSRLETSSNECDACAEEAMNDLGVESWAMAAVVVFGFSLVAFTRHLWYVCIPVGIAAFYFFIRIQGITTDVGHKTAKLFVFWHHEKIIKQILDEDKNAELNAILEQIITHLNISERELSVYKSRIEDIKNKYRYAEQHFPYRKFQ